MAPALDFVFLRNEPQTTTKVKRLVLQTENRGYWLMDTSGLMSLLRSLPEFAFCTFSIPEGAFLRFLMFVGPAEPICFLRDGKGRKLFRLNN